MALKMMQPTQIDHWKLVAIHGNDAARIGIIVPRTIVPTCLRPCY